MKNGFLKDGHSGENMKKQKLKRQLKKLNKRLSSLEIELRQFMARVDNNSAHRTFIPSCSPLHRSPERFGQHSDTTLIMQTIDKKSLDEVRKEAKETFTSMLQEMNKTLKVSIDEVKLPEISGLTGNYNIPESPKLK